MINDLRIICDRLSSREIGIMPISEDGEYYPMSDSDIEFLQSRLGEAFPEDYREYLLQYGSATFGPQTPYFRPERPFPPKFHTSGRGILSVLYGSKEICNGEMDLATMFRRYEERMPRCLIPIGNDGGGNQICLSISGDSKGKVYYWDMLLEVLDGEDYLEDFGVQRPADAIWENLAAVCGSFYDFLGRLESEVGSGMN